MAILPKVAVVPRAVRDVQEAVRRGGAEVTSAEMAEAIIWTSAGDADALAEILRPWHRWVAVPSAGVEQWFAAGLVDNSRTWTCCKGLYSEGVAEHAMALILAAARRLGECARATAWDPKPGRRIVGATVVVIGGGGIAVSLARLLSPLRPRLIAVSRSAAPVVGYEKVYAKHDLPTVLAEADYVVLAAPLTPETDGILNTSALAVMKSSAWVINVGRGQLIKTNDLVAHLRANVQAGAALDVTDPEPLPQGHPLWSMPNVIITPHVANPFRHVVWEAHLDEFLARVERNVRHFAAGLPLEGQVSVDRHY